MKSICILLTFIITTLHAQDADVDFKKNSTHGIVYGLPEPYLLRYCISQERFIKENISINAGLHYISLYGENGGWKMNTMQLEVRKYIPSKHSIARSYWISPHGIWSIHNSDGLSEKSKTNYYGIGFSIGKRRYFIKQMVFWDLGIRVSYGVGIYTYYQNKLNLEENSHKNVYGFLPRFICNFGWKY